jgi:hypothetical protein
VGKHFDNTPTSVEIMQEFRKYAKEYFTEKKQGILDNQIPSIIEEIKKGKEDDRRYPPLPKSETQLMWDREEWKETKELVRESDREKDKASLLEAHLNDLNKEFDSLAFPKYIWFGFASFIVFTILGVIFPLTYNFWGEYLLNENKNLMFLIFHANNIALSLFIIGLALIFAYILVELIHALESKTLDLDQKKSK